MFITTPRRHKQLTGLSQAFKGKIKEQRVKQKTVYRHLEH